MKTLFVITICTMLCGSVDTVEARDSYKWNDPGGAAAAAAAARATAKGTSFNYARKRGDHFLSTSSQIRAAARYGGVLGNINLWPRSGNRPAQYQKFTRPGTPWRGCSGPACRSR